MPVLSATRHSVLYGSSEDARRVEAVRRFRSRQPLSVRGEAAARVAAREPGSSPHIGRRQRLGGRRPVRGDALRGSRANSLGRVSPVEAGDIFGADSAHALSSERLLGVSDRRAIRADRRGLALERGEPSISPIDEPDRRPRSVGAVFDRSRHAMQSDLSLLAVPPDGLLVRVVADAYDHVVERPLRTCTTVGRLIERRPSAPKAQRLEWLACRLGTKTWRD